MSTKTRLIPVLGMDERLLNQGFYHRLQNVCFREDLECWDTQLGWEPLFPANEDTVFRPEEYGDIYSLYCHYTNNGQIEYVLREQVYEDELRVFFTYPDQKAPVVPFFLSENRTPPRQDDPGTQYVKYGDFVLFLNGGDRARKFRGGLGQTSAFGFLSAPPSPSLLQVDPTTLVPNTFSKTSARPDTSNNRSDGIAMFPHIPDVPGEYYSQPPELDVTYSPTNANPPNPSVLADYVGQALETRYTETLLSGVLKREGGIPARSNFGLGDGVANGINSYSYRIAWVSDSGSESPLSAPVSVNWTIPEKEFATNFSSGGGGGGNIGNEDFPLNPFGITYGVVLSSLPTGPDNVVGRRIYRTKNMRDGKSGAGEEYFLVREIRDNTTDYFIDVIPDSMLVARAPSIDQSAPLAPSFKYGTSWDGRIWLAGGIGTEGRIIWSEAGRPEQFGAASYFDLSVRGSGEITAIIPYNDMLVVFRTKSIEAIRRVGQNYQAVTLYEGVGTIATNTVKNVPGVGVMFLSHDGVYRLSGGFSGGSTINVELVSAPIAKWMQSLNKPAMARSIAIYSDLWKEYWVHFPADSSDIPNRGAVLHLPSLQWSVRGQVDEALDYWGIRAFALDRAGNVLMGMKPIEDEDENLINVGVQLLCRSGFAGERLVAPQIPIPETPNNTWTDVDTDTPLQSLIISSFTKWDPKASTVKAELLVYQTNCQPVNLGTMVNERLRYDQPLNPTPLVESDSYRSQKADACWEPVPGGHLAVANGVYVNQYRTVYARADVYTQAKDSVAWYFKGNERLLLQSWKLEFNNNRSNLKA
jgi:hypothetical protein